MNDWMKRIWRCITPMIVYVVVNLIVMFIASAAISSIVLMRDYKSDMMSVTKDPVKYEQYLKTVEEVLNQNLLLVTGLGFLAMIPFLLWMTHRDQKRLRMPQSELPVAFWSLLPVLGVSLCLLLNGLVAITPLADALGGSYEETATTIYSANIWMQYLSVGILAPIAEELIFRGLMYKRMRTFLTAPLAIMITGAMFGIYHGNALQFLYAMILGFALAYIYETYRSVIATIIIHASANLISVLMTNRLDVQHLIAKDIRRYTQTTIICGIITVACLSAIIIYLKKKGVKEHE